MDPDHMAPMWLRGYLRYILYILERYTVHEYLGKYVYLGTGWGRKRINSSIHIYYSLYNSYLSGNIGETTRLRRHPRMYFFPLCVFIWKRPQKYNFGSKRQEIREFAPSPHSHTETEKYYILRYVLKYFCIDLAGEFPVQHMYMYKFDISCSSCSRRRRPPG